MKRALWMIAVAGMLATMGCKRDRDRTDNEPITAPVAGEATDEAMNERVMLELRAEPALTAADQVTIVTSPDGVLVLRGSVPTEAERGAAERAARRAAGDKEIRNELVVVAPMGAPAAGTQPEPGAPGTPSPGTPGGTQPGTMGTPSPSGTGTPSPSGTGTPAPTPGTGDTTGTDTDRPKTPPDEPPTTPPSNPSAPNTPPTTGGGGY